MAGYPAAVHTATPVTFPHSTPGGGGGGGPYGGPPPSSHHLPPGAALGPPGGAAPVPDSYFTESRKGEVNELRNLLRNFTTERDPLRKREIIKKVIAYMTLGIDVSRLFTEMMLAIETRDLVVKKMVYLYLCNYAQKHPELAQMCTNTLQKDCGNEDPMVRGLALRALCSLNLPQMVEYISEPLRKSLQDHHAYVRKTGVMGILKLYYLDQESFEQCNFTDILYDMLRDVDSSVVSNAIVVLNEVMAKTPNGGMAINRAIMLHLLNRIHEFAAFQVVQVLELVPRYIPANAEEGFQIMNLLDPVLRTSSCSAVMATVRAFLSMAEQIGDVDMKRQVVSRVKAPLVTLVSSGDFEIVYCLLKQIQALMEVCPGSFDDEYRQFYIKYNEPTNVKYLKVELLALLANPDTAPDIVAELAELIHSNDPNVARLAVRSMARIACRDTGGPGCAESIAQRMVESLEYLHMEHIQSEAATALTLIVRKHPSLKPVASMSLARTLKYVTEPTGKASIIYLLGECGDLVPSAPYALEKLIDSYDSLGGEAKDVTVKHALLNATMKLFFQRPPEVQHMLGRLLKHATDDMSSQDLHDRALFYFRLLRSGADPKTILRAIVQTNAIIPHGAEFSEDDDSALRTEIMDEFNTLATIYGKASVNFIAPEFQVSYKKMPEEHPLEELGAAAAAQASGQVPMAPQGLPEGMMPQQAPPPQQDPDPYGVAAPSHYTPTPPQPDYSSSNDMIGDLLGFDGPAVVVASSAPPPAAAAQGGLSLSQFYEMSGEEYQAKWVSVADSSSIVTMLPLPRLPAATGPMEEALKAVSVHTMASGELPNEFKFFLYAKDDASQQLFLIQSNVGKDNPSEALMIITIKVVAADASIPTLSASQHQGMVDQLMQILERGVRA